MGGRLSLGVWAYLVRELGPCSRPWGGGACKAPEVSRKQTAFQALLYKWAPGKRKNRDGEK